MKPLRHTSPLLLPSLKQQDIATPALSWQTTVANRINHAHQQCLASPATGLLYARNAGEWLLQVQQRLSPTQWHLWLTQACCFSEQTAQTYMQIAKGWPKLIPSADIHSTFIPTDLEVEAEEVEEQEPLHIAATLEPAPQLSVASGLTFNDLELKIATTLEPVPQLPSAATAVKPFVAEKLTFFIPGGVVPKARPRVTVNGTYLPKRYRVWRNHAEAEIARQLWENPQLPALPLQRAAIKVCLTGKHRMNADADNIIGSCLDALVAVGVLKNDNLTHIQEMRFKLIPTGQKGVRITLESRSTDE